MKIKKGDTVQIITGKDKGKTGRIIKVHTEKQRVVVEGLNMVSKHQRPTQENPSGGYVDREAPLHISNLMLIDPKSGEATKVGRKRDEKSGKLVRFAKNTGEVLK